MDTSPPRLSPPVSTAPPRFILPCLELGHLAAVLTRGLRDRVLARPPPSYTPSPRVLARRRSRAINNFNTYS